MTSLSASPGQKIAEAIRKSPEAVDVYRNVLWLFGDREHGYEPGSFRESLLIAFARADPHNFHRLEAAFPLIGSAVNLAKNVEGGMDIMREAVSSV
jgi:hypothetical protein